MEPRTTSFITLLTSNVRRRHEHVRVGKRVISFVVQIEFLWKNEWRPVVRYDTSHGFAHRDLIAPSGRVDKTPLFLHSFNEALGFAEADLRTNWQGYIARFLEEAGG